jgi:DnaJ-class molecular chaperone
MKGRKKEPLVAVPCVGWTKTGRAYAPLVKVGASVGRQVMCPECSGRGTRVIPEWAWDTGDGEYDVEARCPRCDGDGWVYMKGLSRQERLEVVVEGT